MANVLRILDANFNRAREALRVMEEAARFLLDDAKLSESLKSLRHDLSQTLAAVPALEANRDTIGDVGTSIRTDSEATRASTADVVVAAGKRLSEALRAIEEYGKTLGDSVGAGGFAARIEAMRYKGYEIERKLNAAMGSGAQQQWKLCVLVTESLCRDGDWRGVIEQAVTAGADCVQVREKELDSGWLLRRAREVVELCAGRASVIINDRPDIALLSGADGVHVGQTDLPVSEVRRLVGKQLLVGVSTSNLTQAKRALSDGADYCGVGTMFHTTTKHKDVIVGPDYLREYLAWGKMPHLAIGGISLEKIGELASCGVQGIAVSSAVCGAEKPGDVVKQLLAPIGNASTV